MSKMRIASVLLLVLVAAGLFANGQQESGGLNYPNKPIKLIVPWSAGGSSDAMARAFSGMAEKYLGKPLVVVNRDGAGGTIATAEVKAAAADGYTLVQEAVGVFTAQPFMREVSYTIDDFDGIIGLTYEPILLAVNADSGINSIEDFKNLGASVKCGGSGTGSFLHLAQMAFFDQIGVEADYVPYKGGAPTVTALLGGHIDVAAAHPGELIQHAEEGNIKIIGIFSPERFAKTPDIPTFDELGLKDLYFSVWKFIMVPKGVDPAIRTFLAEAFTNMMNDPSFQKFAESTNLTLDPVEADEIIRRLKAEAEINESVIRKIGL